MKGDSTLSLGLPQEVPRAAPFETPFVALRASGLLRDTAPSLLITYATHYHDDTTKRPPSLVYR